MDTNGDLSAMFQDRGERRITVNVLVLSETAETFLEENSVMTHTIQYSIRCIEMKLEANTGAEYRRVKMLVPGMDIAHRAKENHHEHNAGTRGR